MNIINIKDNSGKLYYVGGVVRDFLLGRKSLDVDLTYEGDAIEFAQKSGLEILQANEPFATVRVKIDGREVDIASTRKEVYEKKGHLPFVTEVGCSLKDDILRRDFTVNTLAMRVGSTEVIDFSDGLKDLKEKKLRVLHDKSFIDDPTRIIRALKFSLRFGFELDEHSRELQENYLKNINYDMCYKRIKKELVETFNLNSIKAFERFINEEIYKLVTPKTVTLPSVNIEKLINQYGADYPWLVYAGVLGDLSHLELTKAEQKILDDLVLIKAVPMNTDIEIYKAFNGKAVETVLLYAVLGDENIARRYLDKLCKIKLSITGADLQKLGIKPSPKYGECFDYVLSKKLESPCMTRDEELEAVKGFITFSK